MAREIRFGGTSQLPSKAAAKATGPLETLLGELSWKYVKAEPEFDANRSFTELPEKEYRQYLAHWAGRIWFHANPMPTGPALREFDLMSLDREYREYLRVHGGGLFDHGLTIEEIWGSTQLFSAAPTAAVASRQYADLLTARIESKLAQSSQSMVLFLAMLSLEFPQIHEGNGFHVMVTDGDVGHTIYIKGVNGVEYEHPRGPLVRPGWFSIHDPWPARSLLATERNFKGVQLLEDITRPPLWLISPDDLDKVVAAFMLPVDWMPMMGNLFKAVDMCERAHAGSNVPLWLEELAPDPTQPFSMLLALLGNVTPSTAESLAGLGRYQLLLGDREGASKCFEKARELGAAG